MIICLQTRQGEIHYISWSTPARDYYFVMCGKYFFKKDYLTTFGIDQSISNACISCQKAQDHTFTFRNYHNNLNNNTILNYRDIQAGWETPKEIFEDLLNRRLWSKLRRMKYKTKQPAIKRLKKYKRHYESGQSKRK